MSTKLSDTTARFINKYASLISEGTSDAEMKLCKLSQQMLNEKYFEELREFLKEYCEIDLTDAVIRLLNKDILEYIRKHISNPVTVGTGWDRLNAFYRYNLGCYGMSYEDLVNFFNSNENKTGIRLQKFPDDYSLGFS